MISYYMSTYVQVYINTQMCSLNDTWDHSAPKNIFGPILLYLIQNIKSSVIC